MMQILQTLTFWALGGLLLLFALGTLIFRNMVHAFLSFMAALLCVAGIYFSLQADYLGGVQVIVYAGSVAILAVFWRPCWWAAVWPGRFSTRIIPAGRWQWKLRLFSLCLMWS